MSVFSVSTTEVFPPDDFLTAMVDACDDPVEPSVPHPIGPPAFSLAIPMKISATLPADDRPSADRVSVSFLVRLWREPREDSRGAVPRPRGYVRNLATGDERFVGADRLGELLLAQLDAPTANDGQA